MKPQQFNGNKVVLVKGAILADGKPELRLIRYRHYLGEYKSITICLGSHPQIAAKLAYLETVKLPKNTDREKNWHHRQKIKLIKEYLRLKSLVETVEEASND